MKVIRYLAIFLLLFFFSKMEGATKDSIIIVSKTQFNAMGAYLSTDSNNTLFLNWTEEIDTSKTNILKYRVFDPKLNQFEKEVVIPASIGMQSHHESMPKLGKTSDGILYAVFRIATPNAKSRFAGGIFYAISKDNGKSWSKRIKLVNDENAVSQSFYDISLMPDGELGLTWLDSRKFETEKDGSSLYFAKTKGSSGFQNQKPIVGSTCQCCRTDIYVENERNIHIAFRNIGEGSIRDMYSVVSTDNGTIFSQPKIMSEDNWKLEGCPHTGPSLGTDSKDLSVVWFTGAKSGSGIFYKKLNDEISFIENKVLVSQTGKHPQMVVIENGNTYIVYEDYYLEDGTSYSLLVLHIISSDGSKREVVLSQPKTNNDHAVITKLNKNRLLVSWTNTVVGKTQVVYKTIEL